MSTGLVTPALPPTPDPRPPEPAQRAGVLSAFTLPRVVVALAMAVLVAIVLNPVFTTRFPVLLGRTLVIAMLLLLAYTVAGIWKPPMLPRWVGQVLAVVVVAPIATFLVLCRRS